MTATGYEFDVEFLDLNKRTIDTRTIRAVNLTKAVEMAARRTAKHVSAVGFVVSAKGSGEVTDEQITKSVT